MAVAPETGRLLEILTLNGNDTIQENSYEYDKIANLAARTDHIHGMREDFIYDRLNRLRGIVEDNDTTARFDYDAYGRMLRKYMHSALVFDSAAYNADNRPHAIVQAQTPLDLPLHRMCYTHFDKLAYLEQDTLTLSYIYGYEHQRLHMTEANTHGDTLKQKEYVSNCEYIDNGVYTTTLTYLSGPLGVFGVQEQRDGYRPDRYFIHPDHLGNWTLVTDNYANIQQDVVYDAWGTPYCFTATGMEPATSLLFDRGFTGHEHLLYFGLINMNGRMYDPVMSSFLSPDNFIQSPDYSQSFNRYAYCLNNPLKYVDPDGEWFLTWGLDYGKRSDGNYGITGGSLGVNFGGGGFGVHANWGDGFTMGVYGEVGPNVGNAGATVTLGVDYNFKYGTTTAYLSAGYGFSYGIGRAGLGVGGSYTWGLPDGINPWNASVSANLGVAGSMSRYGQMAGFGLSCSYGTQGWGFGAHSYCEVLPAQEKLNRIVAYYADELAAVGDADAKIQAIRRIESKEGDCNGITIPGTDVYNDIDDKTGHFENNKIYLSYKRIRQIWKGDVEAEETLFHEWKHGVQWRSGEASELIYLYGNDIASDILEVRAYCFDYNRIHTAYRYDRIWYYGFYNPKHPGSLIKAFLIDEGIIQKP